MTAPRQDHLQRNPVTTEAVLTVEALDEVVTAIKDEGIFCFDVETRGVIDRHPDVLDLVEVEWLEKEKSLKTLNPSVRERSKQAIYDRWANSQALDTLRNEVFWIGIAVSGRSWVIPMGHPNGEVLIPEERGDGNTVPPEGHRKLLASGKESKAKSKYHVPATFSPAPDQLTDVQVFGALEEVFMDPYIPKVGHNIKFDVKSIAKYYGGALPKGLYIDTMVLQHVLDENLMKYSLINLCEVNYGMNPYDRYGKIGDRIQTQSFSQACEYVHLDARWTWMLYKRLWRQLEKDSKLLSVAYSDLHTLPVLAQMELNGILVAERKLNKLGKELQIELNTVRMDMTQYAPLGFNPDANKDKQLLLFGKKRAGGLGLPIKKRTGGGDPSVDKSVLEKLKGKHPMVDLLLKWQELKKMKSTYVDGMKPQLNHGRLHPQFHLHRTDTGRLSSSNPNLQNIPSDNKVRGLFIAAPGDRIVVADYGQIELRVMAMFSKDPNLSNIFIDGTQDLHTATACLVLGREYGDVDGDERKLYGKMPNFLMGYGGTASLLSDKIGIPIDQAQEVVDGYKAAYSRLFEWKAEVVTRAHHRGYVETYGGRRRRLEKDLASLNQGDKWRAERQAVNAIVQGTASEICKAAMVRVHTALDYPACKMLVQVHDELVVSVPADESNDWLKVIETEMGNGQIMMDIPLLVEGNTALSWYDAK